MRRTIILIVTGGLLLAACQADKTTKKGAVVSTATAPSAADDPTCGDNDPHTMCKDGQFLSGEARLKAMTDCLALADEVNRADAKKKTLTFNSALWKTQNGLVVAGAGRMARLGCFK